MPKKRRWPKVHDPAKIVLNDDSQVGLLPQPDLEGFEGYLESSEGPRLAFLASQVPEGLAIVEVGSFKGLSACYLARGSKAGAGNKVHCVDFWEVSGQEFQRHYEAHARFSDPTVFDTFQAKITRARVKTMVEVHKGSSVEIAAGWSQPIGLLFVDADHHYDAVTADIRAWSPHLASGAVVAFHDYWRHDRFPGVSTAVHEFVAAHPGCTTTRTQHMAVVHLPATTATSPVTSEEPVEATVDGDVAVTATGWDHTT